MLEEKRKLGAGKDIVWIAIVVVLILTLVFVVNAIKISNEYKNSESKRVYFNPITEENFGWNKIKELLKLESPFVVKTEYEE